MNELGLYRKRNSKKAQQPVKKIQGSLIGDPLVPSQQQKNNFTKEDMLAYINELEKRIS